MNGHVADGSALLSEAKFGICADINHEQPGSRKPGIWARVSVSFAFSNLLKVHGRSTSIDAVNKDCSERLPFSRILPSRKRG
jgi:hypothetical protein